MDDHSSTAPYTTALDPQNVVNEPYELFNLDLDDDQLIKMCVKSLDKDIGHWEQKPWLLKQTDTENINYLLGDQLNEKWLLPHQARYVDNRLHAGVRSILAYATGQTGKPELLPSKNEDRYKRIAKNLELFLYQHALDHEVNSEMRLAFKNLVIRKRGYIKLRYDDGYGPFGDICTENIDPADIVVDRFTGYRDNPNRIYHKQKCTIEELIGKFPDKEKEIKSLYSIIRGTFSQLSRQITYWECWFTYWDQANEECEAVCWFIPDSDVILGKMQNPNWLYKGSKKQQMIKNLVYCPPKPFIILNYLNTGRSYIDETCLLDQAIPMQDILNKRGRQIVENADYANPRILVDKRVMEESDAKKFVSKHPKTIGLVDTTQTGNDIQKAIQVIPGAQLPSFVLQDKLDARAEIDTMLGTPVQFRGDNPQTGKNPTLGQDLLVKNQAGALQDDLVEVINRAWRDYYKILMQMCLVYLPDDYWVMTKGTDGEYVQIALHDENLDTNVRISVRTDSTLPLDKQSQRATAVQLAQMPGRLDDLSLFEMLGLPDAEKLAERVQRFNIDRYTYMESIEQKLYDAEAEADIGLVLAGKMPAERDGYSEDYLNHWNIFMTTNRFLRLPLDMKQKCVAYLHMVANKASLTQGLQDSMLSPAGIINRPPIMPLPKRTMQIRLVGNMDPNTTQNIAGGEAAMAVPLSQLQAAQSPQGANPQVGQTGQASPPRVTPGGQFGP